MIWKIKDAQYEFQKAAFAVVETWINQNEMVASHECEEPQGLKQLINSLTSCLEGLEYLQDLCVEMGNNDTLISQLNDISFSLDRTECNCHICVDVKYAEYQVAKDIEETQRSLDLNR